MLGSLFSEKRNSIRTICYPDGRRLKLTQFEIDYRKHKISEAALESVGCACYSEYIENGMPSLPKGTMKSLAKRFNREPSVIESTLRSAIRKEKQKNHYRGE